MREVEEETGVPIILRQPLTTQRYRLGAGHTKEVYYWLGVPAPESAAIRARPVVTRAPAKEIDQTRWLTVALAQAMIARRGDRRLLDDLVSRAENGTLVTSTLVIARHAGALSRQQWRGEESARPLTRSGAHQAMNLVAMASALGIERLISSPWNRCVATLGPYAHMSGQTVTTNAALTEDAVAVDPRAARDLVFDCMRHPQSSTIVCGHRPVLPHMIAPIEDIAPSGLVRELPTEDPWMKTGQLLVAHLAYPKRVDSTDGDSTPATVEGLGAQLVAIDWHRAAKPSISRGK